MLTVGRRNRMDKSLNMRAWLKVNHDALADMGLWTVTLNTFNPDKLLYAQGCMCIVWLQNADTLCHLCAIIKMCTETGQTGNNIKKFKKFLLFADFVEEL